MTIPVTLAGPQCSSDLVLPAHLQIAVLCHQLAALTGQPLSRLTTLDGRTLDPEIGLRENGVCGGAVLIGHGPDSPPSPYADDDVADLAARQVTDPTAGADLRGGLLALVMAAVAGGLSQLPSASAVLCLLAVVGSAFVPRLVQRGYRLDADADPTDPAVRQRVAAAQRMMLRSGRALTTVASGGAVALVGTNGGVPVLAGWLALVAVGVRTVRRDRLCAVVVLAATAAAVVAGLSTGGWLPLVAATVGVLVIGGSLYEGDRPRPLLRLLSMCLERSVNILLPIALVTVTGLLPELPL